MLRPPPTSTLFPYTTLFRSCPSSARGTGALLPAGCARERISALDRGVPSPARQPMSALLPAGTDRKSTRLNSSHGYISYAVFCLKKKKRDLTYNVHDFLAYS